MIIIKSRIGRGTRIILGNRKCLDISVYNEKWFTMVKMSLWENGNGIAINSYEKSHFNYEKIFPENIATKIAIKAINKQSQRVAGVNVIDRLFYTDYFM